MTYKYLRELGKDGFGHVFEVADKTGKTFALNKFEPYADVKAVTDRGIASQENIKVSFKREVKYQYQLNSNDIVRILDHDLDADEPWFVMELATGTLQDDIQYDRSFGGDPARVLFDTRHAGAERIWL
jgi:serine/threonine protein kinase